MNTYGEILVGASFNPSGDSDVTYVKNECAKLINLAENVVNKKLSEIGENAPKVVNVEVPEESKWLLHHSAAGLVYETAVQKLLEAQMFLVKLITLPVK